MKRSFAFILFLFCYGISGAQVSNISVTFPPFGAELFLSQVGQITFINNNSSIPAMRIKMDLYRKTDAVYSITTQPFTLEAGMSFPLASVQGQATYYSNNASTFFKNTGTLSAGNYTLNLTLLYAAIGEQLTDDYNTDFTIDPLICTELSFPGNGDIIPTITPQLLWISPQPGLENITYTLIIYEPIIAGIKKSTKLKPFFLANNISGNSFPYTGIDKPLEFNKTYPWQVVAYEEGVELCKSEIWNFTPKPGSSHPHNLIDPADSSIVYWIMENKIDGGHYDMRDGKFHASFTNMSTDTSLHYTLKDISNPISLFDTLPYAHLKAGFNKVDLDFTTLSYMVEGHYYLMEIQLSNGDKYKVKFFYNNENEY